jgi:hypothetical protein
VLAVERQRARLAVEHPGARLAVEHPEAQLGVEQQVGIPRWRATWLLTVRVAQRRAAAPWRTRVTAVKFAAVPMAALATFMWPAATWIFITD